jgi:hypothetical protein
VFIERSPSGVTKIIERAVGGVSGQRPGLEMHSLRADVMVEDLAELVIGHLAEIGRPAAETGDAGGGVAGAAARGLDGGPHSGVEQFRALGIDEVHRALDDGIVDEEGLVAAGDDIDNRIADAQDVELVHSVSSLLTAVVLRSRSSLIGFWSGWNPAKGACRAEAQFFPGSASRRLSS